jgi:putative Holliday junction resolvase
MAVFNLMDLLASLGRDQRVIGIDPGSRTIGLALSDVRRMLASPYGSLKRGKLRANAAEIAAIAKREGVGGLIVGLPLSMDGSAGPAAQAARDWTFALSGATGLPAAMWDERLSSAAVNRFLINEADLSRTRRAEAVDRAAAAWMLQAALDAGRRDGSATDRAIPATGAGHDPDPPG